VNKRQEGVNKMARKTNYGYEKRQKELAKKAKKEEKSKRKQEEKDADAPAESPEE
jgi:hypothetical protein